MEEMEEQQQEEEEQQQQQVEENVWSKYPEELHMAILKRLPWMDKLRLRRVCVLWNSILRDPSLLKGSRSPAGSVSHFCCLNPNDRGGEFLLYSPIGRSWQKFMSKGNFKVIAAAGGLLLMQGDTDVKRTLILLNPLNRSQRQLCLPPDLEDIAVHQSYVFEMTVDGVTDAIRILAGVWHVASDNNINVRNLHLRHWHGWKFYVYNLDSNSWKVVADLCLKDEGYPDYKLAEQLPSVTLLGDDLFLLSTFHGTSSHLYRVRPTFQPSQRTRLEVEQDLVVGGAPLPPCSSYVESKLFESEGRLVLILRHKFRMGKVEDFRNNFWELSVYEFDFLSSEWKVMLDLPPPLARSWTFVTFDNDAGVVCFHNDDFTGTWNFGSKTWTRLPPPPVLQQKDKHAPVKKIFLFEPRLDIIL